MFKLKFYSMQCAKYTATHKLCIFKFSKQFVGHKEGKGRQQRTRKKCGCIRLHHLTPNGEMCVCVCVCGGRGNDSNRPSGDSNGVIIQSIRVIKQLWRENPKDGLSEVLHLYSYSVFYRASIQKFSARSTSLLALLFLESFPALSLHFSMDFITM